MRLRRNKWIAILLILIITITSVPFPKMKSKAASIEIYEGEGFKVEFTVDSTWEGFFNGTMKITNTGEEVLHNWYLLFSWEHEITNIWNGIVKKHTENKYVIGNAEHNQDIGIGKSVDFGFTAKTNGEVGIPVQFIIPEMGRQVPEEQYKVTYATTSEWDTGFNGSISIENLGTNSLEDWILQLDFERNIQNIWDAKILEHESDYYVIENADHNANIKSGKKVTFGFGGNGGNKDMLPSNFVLWERLSDDDMMELLDEEGAGPDDDGDGLSNSLELQIGTDLNNPDTDGDVLPDGYEYYITRTDPLKKDTDDNKVFDGDEDFDEDQFNNQKEYELGTDPYSTDTDQDGLTDYEEVMVYLTDPLNPDTDQDKVLDGDEQILKFDPLNPDTNKNGILDGDEYSTQNLAQDKLADYNSEENEVSASIQFHAKNNINTEYNSDCSVEITDYDKALLEDVHGITGKFLTVDTEADFDWAELKFQLLDKEENINDYAIAWYNQDACATEIIDTTKNQTNRTLTAKVTHFSTYFVINTKELSTMIGNKENTNGQAEVVFVVDTTGSMGKYIDNVKNTVETFVENLNNQGISAKLGLVEFKDYKLDDFPSKNYGWFSDVNKFKKALSSLEESGGGGDGPETPIDGLECARRMGFNPNADKYMIMVTDANHHLDNQYGIKDMKEMTELLAKDKISTSVITTSKWQSLYEPLYSSTDGIYMDMNGDFAVGLKKLQDKIKSNMKEGKWIVLSTLEVIRLKADPEDTAKNLDTDMDGILDKDELYEKVEVDMPEYKGSVWLFHSNPAKIDTDKDFLADGELQEALYKNIPELVEDQEIHEVNGEPIIFEKADLNSTEKMATPVQQKNEFNSLNKTPLKATKDADSISQRTNLIEVLIKQGWATKDESTGKVKGTPYAVKYTTQINKMLGRWSNTYAETVSQVGIFETKAIKYYVTFKFKDLKTPMSKVKQVYRYKKHALYDSRGSHRDFWTGKAIEGPFYEATDKAVAYCTESINFIDEAGIFQFLSWKGYTKLTNQQATQILKDTTNFDTIKGYEIEEIAKAFNEAAKDNDINFYSLVAKSVVEVGGYKWMTLSPIAKTGLSPEGYDGKYYNFFNLGGYDNIQHSAIHAAHSSRKWTTPMKAIKGGAAEIKKLYVNENKYTLYNMRFDSTRLSDNYSDKKSIATLFDNIKLYAENISDAIIKGTGVAKFMYGMKNGKVNYIKGMPEALKKTHMSFEIPIYPKYSISNSDLNSISYEFEKK